ncbi:hypothetical protein GHT06_008983 [Daphnia sinensis]|uniref:Uncharacterized protein n=1 Tax=Daphnia sinensis TaxID=1820382 RepID=A0AAD5PZD4_9CRUS|nr:hypothetical protein GHT06_008983 [Daphnia sinensis]
MECFLKFSYRLQFAFALLLAFSGVGFARNEGSVGCLFQNEICKAETEWCYNDEIFGQCLPIQTETFQLSPALHRSMIGENELAALEVALTQLKRKGYQWTDSVSQCVLQRLIRSLADK